MFEKASRLKLRFSYKGLCAVEDLWDLPLKALDAIFKELNTFAKTQKEESLLDSKTKENEILDLSLDIIKHIVKTRLEEKAFRTNELARKTKKKKLLEILADKQDEKMRNMSEDDLKKLVNEL